MRLRGPDQPGGHLLHGHLHAAPLHDPSGPALRPRGQGTGTAHAGRGDREGEERGQEGWLDGYGEYEGIWKGGEGRVKGRQ